MIASSESVPTLRPASAAGRGCASERRSHRPRSSSGLEDEQLGRRAGVAAAQVLLDRGAASGPEATTASRSTRPPRRTSITQTSANAGTSSAPMRSTTSGSDRGLGDLAPRRAARRSAADRRPAAGASVQRRPRSPRPRSRRRAARSSRSSRSCRCSRRSACAAKTANAATAAVWRTPANIAVRNGAITTVAAMICSSHAASR